MSLAKLLSKSGIAFFLVLTGCKVGPDYHPPEVIINDLWSSAPLANEECETLYDQPLVAWWQLLNDPLLNKYIEMAALHNNEILAAEANICQARALKQVAASDLFPHVSADLSALRLYLSKNGLFSFTSGGQSAAGRPFSTGIPRGLTLYNALIDATWEIDLFGKTRRSVEAAEANIGSAIEYRNDVLISILAEVAINYIELRSHQQRGVLLEENVSLIEQNAYLAEKRYKVGYKNLLDVERIEAELAAALALLPDIGAQIYQNIYALSMLTGNLPETLLCELLPMQPLPCQPTTVRVGIRSDLLRRRPDVRQVERQLAAATANIGVAVASFFPTFNLLGGIGLQSLHLNNLFQAKSLTWAIGGDIHQPIFQGGKLVGNLHANESQAAATAFMYKQTVLRALQEAETALAAYSQELKTAGQLREAVSKYERLIFITNERYTKGLVNLTDLLDVERQWNVAEQNLLISETTALINLISLYKALGGGWEPPNKC